MFNLDSYNNHNSEYVQDEAFEREKRGHLEHDLEDFKFLYQDDLPHGNTLDKKKVKYIVGFAEEELNKLKLKKPALFSTMCVLAHLCDEDVVDILKAVDKVAPVGSVWSASEPWGDEYHRDCWHIRTPEWWSDNMPDWEFEFYADYALTDPPGRYKGFTAIKS